VKKTFQISIQGLNFSIASSDDEEHIRDLVKYLNHKMEEIKSKTKTSTTQNLAILSALNIADDFLKLKRQHQGLKQDINNQLERVSYQIDNYINGEVDNSQ